MLDSYVEEYRARGVSAQTVEYTEARLSRWGHWLKPKRIDHAHMEAMWREAANCHGEYSSHLWVTILALLYGTGLRRGELERLIVDAFDRNEGLLRIDGRKTRRERCVPLPEMAGWPVQAGFA